MDLFHRQPVSFDDGYSGEADLLIGVSGYEKHSLCLMERIEPGNEPKLVPGFEERLNARNRPENDGIPEGESQVYRVEFGHHSDQGYC